MIDNSPYHQLIRKKVNERDARILSSWMGQ